MIQYVLLFVLGFLSALLLALLVAPALWRRAVRLTRNRLESTLPMTMAEIQADKDAVRADYAMAVRRLEMSLKAAQDKVLTQSVDISRYQEDLKLLDAERAEKAAALQSLAGREEELNAALERLRKNQEELERRARELDDMGARYEDASYSSSNRQIELVSREAEIERLTAEITSLRRTRKDGEERIRALEEDNKAIREALLLEKRRVTEAEQKLERMRTELSDCEEKLERREREIVRLREKSGQSGGLDEDDDEEDLPPGSDEKSRQEARMTRLLRENKKIRAELSELKAMPRAAPDQDDLLRDQMHQLAAQVVAMTAKLEGPDSPIESALAKAETSGKEAALPSLAERIRALQGRGAG
ncbi:coiled-coil domain-containing protein [Oryzicola mucosus]|uniref:Uncharacterized protein n=1 Tax=Oryzicola mucosus TaxID=2767425 RepID=A0A8J6U796_9HYPH|nr:hypothetical protein [Oryzicola mucosus]MBD0414477.1 hypothetical protein [Oryzicola mucosus]